MILLLGFALRAWQLTAVPPGLTHDEAGHGHDAAYILKGVRLIYFTVGSGREPLFDYANAALIAGMGASPFTLRFSAAVFGLIALAGTYRVARIAFDRRTATLALALMAVSFWPLATGRQILRSAMLPGEMAIAVMLFLKPGRVKHGMSYWLPAPLRGGAVSVIGLGLAIAASLYTYIPARILWLMFPLAFTTHYAVRIWHSVFGVARGGAALSGPPATPNPRPLLSLLLAFALAAPLFLYLYRHPEAEQRIGQLSEPISALWRGDPWRLVDNSREFLLALFLPGRGDPFLAYTIPGRPLFDPVTFLLFLAGLVLLVRRAVADDQSSVAGDRLSNSPARKLGQTGRQLRITGYDLRITGYWLLVYWLLLGLAPSFVTGPEAMTTRIIGAQPVLYILPALALSRLADGLPPIAGRLGLWKLGAAALLFATAAVTVRDYFFAWGQSADVRAAYQSTLIAMLESVDGPAVISTVYPSALHDPYIGEIITRQETRWIDARYALLIPTKEQFKHLVPSSTPLNAWLAQRYASPQKVYGTTPLRPDDLDPFFTTYDLRLTIALDAGEQANFNDAVLLLTGRWRRDSYRAGESAEFISAWYVRDASRLGLLHPPAFKTDLNLFTHVLNPDGSILLQQDRLDAPSWDWQAGDAILQVHPFAIPADAGPGDYSVRVGLYDRITGERLVTRDGADHAAVAPLIIQK